MLQVEITALFDKYTSEKSWSEYFSRKVIVDSFQVVLTILTSFPMMSPQSKRNLYRILPFGLIWLVFSMVYSLLERGLLGKLDYYPSTGNPYHFQSSFIITISLATIVGLLVGTAEVLYLNKFLHDKGLFTKIIGKTAV